MSAKQKQTKKKFKEEEEEKIEARRSLSQNYSASYYIQTINDSNQ